MRSSRQIQEACRQRVVGFIPDLHDLDIGKDVEVHSVEGRVRQPIVNYNDKQIALLSKEDLATINTELKQVPELMAHFGYDYISV